jgi:alkylhydroperoxidase family enzyme
MSYVSLLSLDDLDEPARAVAESGYAQYGQLLNTWRALFHRPDMFSTYLPFLRSVAGPGRVAPVVKDLTAILVGLLNNCRYTVSHRCASARRNGVIDADLVAIANHDWDAFDAPTQAALAFTEQLTLAPPATPWTTRPPAVEQSVLDELSRYLDEGQRVELTMSVSVWNALTRFHRVMQFELDMPAPPPEIDPANPTA